MLLTFKLNLPTQITTNRLLLQRLKREDAEEIFTVYASHPEATKFMAWPTHQSIADTHSFLDYAEKAWDEGQSCTYAIRTGSGHPLVGSIGAQNVDGKIMFGYTIGANYWNKGYATEACKALVDRLRLQRGVYRIHTFVDAENVASARVLEKAGLVEEARLKKWFRFVNQGNEPKDCILYNLVF